MGDASRQSPGGARSGPGGRESLFARAAALLRQARLQPSADKHRQISGLVEELEQLLLERPDSVPALRLLAESYQLLDQPQAARQVIRLAEGIDPWNIDLLIISEALAGREGPDPLPARRQSDAAEEWVVDPLILSERAKSALQLGYLERAYSLAKLTLRLQPERLAFMLDVLTIGTAFDPQRALAELELLQTGEAAPDSVFLALGSTCNVLGQYQQAREWLSRGISRNPDDNYLKAMLYNELAYVLVKLSEQLELAVRLARRALEIFPDKKQNGFIRDTLGAAYLKKNDIPKARRNLLEAVSKDPSPIPRLHLALALLHGGDAGGALEQLTHIAAARPSIDSPHLEENHIRQRVQTHIKHIERLLRLGGPAEIADVLEILDGLL